MAHHRLNSSPTAVAQFFKDTLGDRLAEYAPAGSNSPGSGSHPRMSSGGTGDLEAPSNTRSSARLAGAAGNNSGTGSGSRPNLQAARPGTGSGPRPNPAAARTGSGPRPNPSSASIPAAEANTAEAESAEQARLKQAAGQQQGRSSGSTSSRTMLPAAQAPAGSSTRSGIRAMPAAPAVAQASAGPAAAVVPPQTGQRPALAGGSAVAVAAAPSPRTTQVATPAPLPQPSVPAPAQLQSRVGVPAVAPAPAPNPSTGTQPPSEEPAPTRKWGLIAAVVGALIVVAIILMSLLGGGDDGPEVLNLGPRERLYINGLRVEGTPRLDKPGALLVSTAEDGRLRRFGRTERRDRIDVRTIPEALPQPGSTGTLSIVGEPKGCKIKVGNEVLPENTFKTSIEAGKELDVIITCGANTFTASVMAVLGQEVEIDPRPKP
jgi:hypothetical protein